jgi:hypothetical protein
MMIELVPSGMSRAMVAGSAYWKDCTALGIHEGWDWLFIFLQDMLLK